MEDQAKNSRPRLNQQAWLAGALVLLYVALMLNWQNDEHLRFVNTRLNCIGFAAGQSIPIGLLLGAFRKKQDWLKELGCCLVPVAFFAGILFLFALLGITSSNAQLEEGCRLMHSVSLGSSEIKAYRINGGALESYWILIQQERTILPDVVWTKPLYRADPAAEATLTRIDSHHVRCSFPPYDGHGPDKVVVLKVD